MITPKQFQGLARNIDGGELNFTKIYVGAAVQIVFCVLVALGALRWEGVLDPFALNARGRTHPPQSGD